MPTYRTLVASLLKLAWPVALARLGIMGMGLVDVVMVGQLAPRELPHQALGWAPTGVILVTSIGLLTGVQVLAARAIGAGKPTDAGGAWRRGLIVALIAGLLAVALMWLGGARVFTVFGISQELAEPSAVVMRILAFSVPLHLIYIATTSFLEAIQRPMASTIVMWLANGVNFALNLWLVPHMGAAGSAWATLGARTFLALALMAWVYFLKDGAQFGVRMQAVGPSFSALLAVGAAAALSQFAEASAFSVMTIIAGRIGPEAVAAYQILLNMLAIVFMIALGVSTATAVLTSEAIGRRSPREAARASWMGLALNTAIMIVPAVIFAHFAPAIARFYSADIAIAALTAGLVPLAASVFVPDGGQAVTASALRASGDNWFPTASHVFAYALVMPALGFWLGEVLRQGVAGLLLAIFWSSVVSVGVLAARMAFLTRPRALRAA